MFSDQNLYKTLRISEIVWLVLTAACVATASWDYFTGGTSGNFRLFSIFSGICLVMYLIRRNRRIKMGKQLFKK
jgi:hypothetical protein